MDLTQLKVHRKSLRTAFTICANKLDDELEKETQDMKAISVLEMQLKDKFSRLEENQKNVTETLLLADEAEYEEDFNTAYTDRFLELCSRTGKTLINIPLPSDAPEKRTFKLPVIELKKFSGDAKDYLSF